LSPYKKKEEKEKRSEAERIDEVSENNPKI